jgi:chromosome segregation ATPase
MTPEQLEKAIQFLLEQQAALDAAFHRDREAAKEDRQQTEARFRDVAQKLGELGQRLGELAQRQEGTLAIVERSSRQIDALGEQTKTLKEACRDLLEHSGYTDFRLNRLEHPENR